MDIQAGSLDALVKGASQNGGWADIEGALDNVDERLKNNQQHSAKGAADLKTIAAAWKGFSQTPAGQKALQSLCDKTLNAPAFICHMGMNTDQVAVHGAFREGQNDIVRAIIKLIAQSDDENKKPKKD